MAAQELTLPVPRSEVAITAARHQVISELRGWSAHVGAEVLEAVGLVVSELVTNAVQHVPAGPVCVTARLDRHAVAIEVTDSGTVLPRPVLPDEDEEHGRGLLLVAALSARHGSDRTQSGKRCWAEIPLHPAPGSPCP
jgi:anti-sigma regulatory factor (Ser/Thr protein kinase)